MTYSKRYQAIEELADYIRVKLEVKTPIDMEQVVKSLNGDLQAESFEDSTISGKIEKVGDAFKISYNKEHSPQRSGFTIAHEIGHLFLHMGYIIDPAKWDSINEYCDSPKYRQGYSVEEYEANHFAGAFLMPKDDYENFLRENGHNNKIDISLIAEHFNVSFDAALTRGKWLGIFDW